MGEDGWSWRAHWRRALLVTLLLLACGVEGVRW